VTSLSFDPSDTLLASGSQDTDIIIWDIVAESGRVRLKGHKDQITSLIFVPSCVALAQVASESEIVDNEKPLSLGSRLSAFPASHLLSASKDTTIKAWDLSANACVETNVTHRSEVWSMAITHLWHDKSNILTLVSGGDEVKVHKLDVDRLDQILRPSTSLPCDIETSKNGGMDVAIGSPIRALQHVGDLKKVSTQRTVSLKFTPCHRYLLLGCVDAQIQIFKMLNKEESQVKLSRKRKQLKAKDPSATDLQVSELKLKISDEISAYELVIASAKVRSLDTFCDATKQIKNSDSEAGSYTGFMVSLANNSIETFHMGKEIQTTHTVELPGHRGDIRSLALSNDDDIVASAGTGFVKIWNVNTGKCIRSMDTGYSLCIAFVPGGKYVSIFRFSFKVWN
jgi:U3 small nucleolar RNA-associated protein 12